MRKKKIRKPRRIFLKGTHSNKHPELKKGEVLLGNGDDYNWKTIKWKTKRKGKQAYSILHLHRGVHFTIENKFPIFINKDEIKEYNMR